MDTWKLRLASHKCVFTLYFRDKRDRLKENNIDIKIRNERFSHDPNPKFLGIKFDRYLNDSAHIKEIREKTQCRLNIHRILSNKKHWKVKESTLINILKPLIRSIID